MEAQTVDPQEQRLWDEYQRGLEAARARLLEQYQPLARRLAASLYAKRAVEDIEFGDYLHLAYTGLLEAMQRYRYTPVTQFATFATYRIRGAVLNGIPLMSETGHRIAVHKRLLHERTRSLAPCEGGFSTQLADMLDLIAGIAITCRLDELTEADEPNLHSAVDPYGSCEYDHLQRRLREIIERLPERERHLVYYHYFHQMPFEGIAELFELSKSRVSRLHKAVIEQIRDQLRRARLTEIY